MLLPAYALTTLATSRLTAVNNAGLTGRVPLEFLAETGAFVFYGTPSARLTEIQPEQPLTFNEETNEEEPRGPSAVYASSNVDVAVYRALIKNETIAPHVRQFASTHFVRSDGSIQFEASADAITWAARPETVGWVYVLDADRFEPCCRLEMRAMRPVRALAAIRVTGVDLPRGIVVSKYFERKHPPRSVAA